MSMDDQTRDNIPALAYSTRKTAYLPNTGTYDGGGGELVWGGAGFALATVLL